PGSIVAECIEHLIGEPTQRNAQLARDCTGEPAAVICMGGETCLTCVLYPIRHFFLRQAKFQQSPAHTVVRIQFVVFSVRVLLLASSSRCSCRIFSTSAF